MIRKLFTALCALSLSASLVYATPGHSQLGGGGADNLGDHQMTENLDGGGFSIVNVDSVTVTSTVTAPVGQFDRIHTSTINGQSPLNIYDVDQITFVDGSSITTNPALHGTNTNYINVDGSTQSKSGGLYVQGELSGDRVVSSGTARFDTLMVDKNGLNNFTLTNAIQFGNDALTGIGRRITGGTHQNSLFFKVGAFGDVLYLGQNGYLTAQGTATVQDTIAVDRAGGNTGSLNSALIFGGDPNSPSQGIASRKTAGGLQNGLEFYTNNVSRVGISNSGLVGVGTNTATSLLDVYNGSVTVRGTNAGISVNGSPVALASDVSASTSALSTRLDNLDSSTAALTTRADNLDSSTAAITVRLDNLDQSTAAIVTRADAVAVSTQANADRIDAVAVSTGTRAAAVDVSTTALTTRANDLDTSTAAITTRADAVAIATTSAKLLIDNTNYLELSESTQTKTGGIQLDGHFRLDDTNYTYLNGDRGNLYVVSKGSAVIQIDSDNNTGDESFTIRTNAEPPGGSTLFSVAAPTGWTSIRHGKPTSALDISGGSITVRGGTSAGIRTEGGLYSHRVSTSIGGVYVGDSSKIIFNNEVNEYIGELGDEIQTVSFADVANYLDSNDDGANAFVIYADGTPGSATEIFRIDDTGNIGVGTDSPSSHIDVNGGSVTIRGGSGTGIMLHDNGVIKFTGGGDIGNLTGNFDIRSSADVHVKYGDAGTGRLMVGDGGGADVGLFASGNITTNRRMVAGLDVQASSIQIQSNGILDFPQAGTDISYLQEGWGIEMHGDATHPVQIRDTALLVGEDATGGSYTPGDIILTGGGTIYSNGNMITPTSYYADLYSLETSSSYVLVTQNEWYDINCTTNTDGWLIGITNTLSTATIQSAGVYDIHLEASFSGTLSQTFEIAIATANSGTQKVPVEKGITRRKLGTGGDVGSTSAHCKVNLAADSVVQAYVRSTSGAGNTFTAERITLSLHKIR